MHKVLIAAVGLLAGSFAASAATVRPVVVPMKDASGADVGIVTFMPHGKEVEMRVELKELPIGEHAIHVHAGGTCTPPDFASAKGHFNPTSKQHGYENPQGHHVGDFPKSAEIREDGLANEKIMSADLSLDPASPNAIYGKTVVVHELKDDQKTDPAGASGKRIACGVIPSAPSM
jgi:Cu-Zn family superoxide dismutase